MNNFFKEESVASNQASNVNTNASFNGSNNLFELQKNPWKIFPNYNKKFDDSLNELIALKNRYYNNHCSYKHLLEQEDRNELASYDLASLFIVGLVILTMISSFTGKYLNNYLPEHPIISIIFSILLGFLFSSIFVYGIVYGFERISSNFKSKNAIKSISIERVKKEENFQSIQRDYKNKIKTLLGDNKSLNIRKHLNHYYDTNIPEINHLIQNILDKYFPEDLEITNNINDNLEQLSQISFSEYINNIQTQLNKIIDTQIINQAGSQIIQKYQGSLHDEKPSILNPEYKGQGIIVTRVRIK